MAPDVAEVLETAKLLKRDQIADLAYALLRVLDDDDDMSDDQEQAAAAWRAEYRRRIDDIEHGKVQPVSHEDTVTATRTMLAARRK